MPRAILIVLVLSVCVGCASAPARESGSHIFQTYVGRAPANAAEQDDAHACLVSAFTLPRGREFAAVLLVPFYGYAHSGRQVEDYKSCLRVKGYTLDVLELNEAGDWVRR